MNASYSILSLNTDAAGVVKLISFAIDYTDEAFPGAAARHEGIIPPAVELQADASDGELIAAVQQFMAPQTPDIEAFMAHQIEMNYIVLTTTVVDKSAPVYLNISARQLWLAALDIDLTKAQVLAKIDTVEDAKLRARLQIEVTEPPLDGYVRESDAVEQLRALMAIEVDAFNKLWLDASKL